MPTRKHKKGMKKLADVIKECKISPARSHTSAATTQSEKVSSGMMLVLDNNQNETISSQCAEKDSKVPPIFLHKPVDFKQHVLKVLLSGVKFYQPHLGKTFTRINCLSFEDHSVLIQYLKSNKLPYHTYGNPNQRKMKVVIKGLPNETSLIALQDELKSSGIHTVRVHKMHTKESKKELPLLVLAVAANNEEGKKLMQLEELMGHNVNMEPPLIKTKQCHRCQKWGHSQRYCHGQVRCVKCAGEHLTSKCVRDPDTEPPKCANCGGEHTASFRKCSYCPESDKYIKIPNERRETLKPVLVTLLNYQDLYKNVPAVTKFEEVY